MRKNIRHSIGKTFVLLTLASAAALPARAQGSRKDDVAFATAGRPIPGATITVCAAGATGTPCSPLATLYTDATLTTTAANPFTADGLGNYHFYAAPGRYVVQISGSGVTTYTMNDVILPSDPFYVALKRTANEAVCYVSPDGSDANDGRSYGTAKATVLGNATQNGCWQTLPANGGTIYLSGGGPVLTGVSVGGTVTGQGLWIAGGSDPNAASLPAGWVASKKVQIVGVSGAQTSTNAFQQAVILCAGSSSDSTKPALWISGTNSPLSFYNITFASINTSGVCTGLNFPGTVIRLGIDSNGNRNTNSGAVEVTLDNVQVPEQANATPAGAVVDIGSNSFWLFFRRFVCAGDSASTTTTSDAAACILVNPGTGSSSSLFVEDSILSNGSLKYYIGSTSGVVVVDNLTTASMRSAPSVWLASSNSSTQVSIRNVWNADSSAAPNFENDGSANAMVSGLMQGASGCQQVKGPATAITNPSFLGCDTSSPESKGQTGIFNGKFIGQQDTLRRNFAPINARVANSLSQTQLPSSWQTVTNLTITTGITAPDGSTNAGQLTCSSGTCIDSIVVTPNSSTVVVGDFFVAGVWARSTTSNGFVSAPFTLNIGNSPAACNGGGGFSNAAPWINGDGGNWEWYYAVCKITTTASTVFAGIQVSVDTTHTQQYFAPVILYLPASSYSVDEAYDIAEHLATFPDNATVGDATPLRGHPISFGASGNNFFGRLVHANTANRTYTFPDGTGNALVGGAGISAQQIAYDNFKRANGPLGSNWTLGDGTITIVSNKADSSTGSANYNDAMWNANTFGPDQFSQITVTALGGPGAPVRMSVSGSTASYYHCTENATTIFIQKITSGSNTTLTSASATGAVGDLLRTEAQGSTLRCYQNGVLKLTTTDSTFTTGQPGIESFGTTAGQVSNWSGGNLSPLGQLNMEADWTQPQHFLNGFSVNTNGFQGTFSGAPLTANQSYTMPNQTGTVALALTATSASLGGSSLAAGTCTSNTTTVTGATTSMSALATPASDPGSSFAWMAFVSSANTVTTRVCNFTAAAATPTATTYNLRLIQ